MGVVKTDEPGRPDVVEVKVVVEGGPQAEVRHPDSGGAQGPQPPPRHGSQARKGHLVLYLPHLAVQADRAVLLVSQLTICLDIWGLASGKRFNCT